MFSKEAQFSHSVVSDSLRRHGLQHARLPCPSPTPGACSNSCPSSWWCHPKRLRQSDSGVPHPGPLWVLECSYKDILKLEFLSLCYKGVNGPMRRNWIKICLAVICPPVGRKHCWQDSPCWSPSGTWWCCRAGSGWCWRSAFPQRGWSTCRAHPVCPTDLGHCSVDPQESAQDTGQRSAGLCIVRCPGLSDALGYLQLTSPDQPASWMLLRCGEGGFEVCQFLWVSYSPLSG